MAYYNSLSFTSVAKHVVCAAGTRRSWTVLSELEARRE